MKKLTTIISAALLVLCFSQCRKESKIVMPVETSKPYSITLNLNGVSKVDVNTTDGENFGKVTFGVGDKVYVADKDKFVGTLTYNTSTGGFSGDIYDPVSGKLYFYFLGNIAPTETVTPGSHPKTLTVDISDQSTTGVPDGSGNTKLPVISCGISENDFSGNGSYNATLRNKCALVKINISKTGGALGNNVFIEGLNNKVVFNMGTTNATCSQTNGGRMNVGSGTGNKWMILLPQESDGGGLAYSEDHAYYGKRGSLKKIVANGYLKDPIEVNVNKGFPSSYPEGAVHGLFSVKEKIDNPERIVFFSKGNLQYKGSTATWKFADNQYDFIGNAGGSSGQGSDLPSVDRDLFGWATSGCANGNYFYYPYCTSNVTTFPYDLEHSYGYGPKSLTDDTYNKDITGAYANSDWGYYNSISNGGNVSGLWRTLTSFEWRWVLGPSSPNPGENCRVSSTVKEISNARFTLAVVNTDGTPVKGMIIFPDIYFGGTPSGVTWGTINYKSNYTTKCTVAGWNALEAAGCVFLPAAGFRDGITVSQDGMKGFYWSASRPMKGSAYQIRFHKDGFDSQYPWGRYYGCAVRLVTNYTE